MTTETMTQTYEISHKTLFAVRRLVRFVKETRYPYSYGVLTAAEEVERVFGNDGQLVNFTKEDIDKLADPSVVTLDDLDDEGRDGCPYA